MGLFFGVIIFCCCAWSWVRGSAFMAFALSAAALFLVALGADEMYCHSAAIRSAIGVGIACAPWLIRSYMRGNWTPSPEAVAVARAKRASQIKAEADHRRETWALVRADVRAVGRLALLPFRAAGSLRSR